MFPSRQEKESLTYVTFLFPRSTAPLSTPHIADRRTETETETADEGQVAQLQLQARVRVLKAQP
jgi:hypothetical protein